MSTVRMPKSRKYVVIIGSAVAISVALVAAVLQSTMNESTRNAIPPNVSVVHIPQGISDPNSIHYGKVHLQPQILYVVVNQNSTVRWINDDFAYHWIVALANSTDLGFIDATPEIMPAVGSLEDYDSPNVLAPGEYFEYTFTKPSEYTYFDGNGGESGKVVVSSNS